MKSNTLFRLSVSAALLALVTVGCKPNATRPAAISSSAPSTQRDADRAAARAMAAIEARDGARAVEQAEKAVALDGHSAGRRALLGHAYLVAGRFGSARAAFRDSLSLDPQQPRVALNLALTELATGAAPAARARLNALDGHAAAADLGLAFALAGDMERAVPMLESAARAEDADARTRQNLALGYALAGRWAEARATAALDLPADRISRRMLEWAVLAQPRTSWDQVAGVLGVTPHYDPGQPVALALVPDAVPNRTAPTAAPIAVAEAAPPAVRELPIVDAPPPAIAANIVPPLLAPAAPRLAVATARPDAVVDAPETYPPTSIARFGDGDTAHYASAPAPHVAEAIVKPATAIAHHAPVPPLIAAPQQPMKVAYVAPIRAPASADRQIMRQGKGNYVVQLGAYSAAARVEVAWNRIASRVRMVEDYTPSSSAFELQQVGTVYRLSLAGFETRAAATSVCEQVRAKGGDCFVRAVGADRPVRWVSRKTHQPQQQLAMR